MAKLLEKSTQLSHEELNRLCQNFMLLQHQPKGPPPYGHTYFTDEGRLVLNMISSIMGFNTSEFVDQLTLVLLSIFTPEQPPAVRYDFSSFISDKIRDQCMRFGNERVFKYSSFIYHLMIHYQSESFPFHMQKLDTKGNPRSVIFWSAITHHFPDSPYSYTKFIDLFVHLATTLLTAIPPPRINNEIKRTLQLSKQYKV